jgi:hypothetical protein
MVLGFRACMAAILIQGKDAVKTGRSHPKGEWL